MLPGHHRRARMASGDPGSESSCVDAGTCSSPICPSCRCVARDCECGNSQVEGGVPAQKRPSLRWPNAITRQVMARIKFIGALIIATSNFTLGLPLPSAIISFNLDFRRDSASFSYMPTIRRWLWRWHRRYRFGEQQEDQVLNVNSGKA